MRKREKVKVVPKKLVGRARWKGRVGPRAGGLRQEQPGERGRSQCTDRSAYRARGGHQRAREPIRLSSR